MTPVLSQRALAPSLDERSRPKALEPRESPCGLSSTELNHLHREDKFAATMIVGIMLGIFLFGLISNLITFFLVLST
jgi:hypothetical protein